MKNVKRILAFVLSVLMVVSCVPGIVFAETGDEVRAVADTQYPGEATYHTYQGANTGDFCGPVRVGTGEALWGKIHIPADKRLMRLVAPGMATYGATTPPKIRVSIFAATTTAGNTDDLNASAAKAPLWETVLTGPADNSDFVCEIPASVSLEGSLYFRLTCEEFGAGGTYQNGFTVRKSSKAANNAAFWFRSASESSNAVLAFQYTVADVVKASASADLTQHTDDPIVLHQIQNYTVSGNATQSKIDFKRPTDRGFLTVEGVHDDPFFEIGTLDAQISKIPGSKMDYIVIKYRTSNIKEGRFFYDFDGRGHYSGEKSTVIPFDNSGEWETVIVHASVLSGESRPVKNLRFDFNDAPTSDGKNPVMDIAYIRIFSTLSGAQACVDAEEHSLVALPITIRDYRADGMLFEYNAIDPDPKGYPDRIHGNNSAFSLTGLIGKFTSDMIQGQYDPEVREKFEELIGKDCPYLVNGTDSNTYQPEPPPIGVILNSGAKQNVYGAEIRYDLVEAELGENGKPVYRQGVVEFIAWYLEKLLPVPETTDGKKNMNFIKGEADAAFGGKDLASYLRDKLVGKAQPGTYAETKARAKDLVGGQALENIKTYMDAAYFLLHNTFVDNDGYGMTAEEYNTLNLVAKTDENGNVRYVFSTAYDNVIYDRVDGIIQNSQFDIATQRRLSGNTGDWYYHRGNKQPVGCFDPLFGLCYDVNGASREQDTYRKMLGNYDTYSENIYYKTTNFHYTMEGHARFVYHYSENLYFTFIGDDDVYLYVNGKRIVDLGGTHPISKVVVNLNDVAEVCGLEEGGIYSFDFFYMERHGTAANLSIETNIRVADADMITEKKAYQKGQEVSFDGMVDHVLPVDYTFSIFNNGKVPFANMTFTDSDIGAALSYKADERFVLPQNVTADKLVLTKYKADGTVYGDVDGITGLTEEQIRQYLIQGLDVGERLTIGGFAYTIPEGKWIKQVDENGDAVKTYFVNHLHTTAIAKPNNVTEKVLKSTDYHRVNMAEYVFESMHVYDWGKLDGKKNDGSFKDVSIGVLVTSEDICDVMERHFGENYFQNRDLSFKLCSPSGNLQGGDLNKNVTVLSNGHFLYNNTKCGADTFYVTCLEGDIAYPPVRVDVYVYGVDDNIFVLDYNLPVTVNTQEQGLLANDILGLTTNPNAMNVKLEFSEFTNHYGDFNVIGEGGLNPSIVYTMKKFMNGEDIVDLKVTLYEEGTNDDPGKFNGVTMHQSVIFAPANVMYYEDDFTGNGAITYVNT
jgi:fibro-slime domain-containing protein